MYDLDATRIALRRPTVADAPAVWRLVRDSDVLDTNSLYYYNLWFRDFADTSIVADAQGRLAGFVTGYVRPERPDTLMAWQSAVAPDCRAPGLAVRMMRQLVDQVAGRGVSCVETTVNPGNRAVIMMLRKFARERGLDIRTEVLFSAEDLAVATADKTHPPEVLYRMAPTSAVAATGSAAHPGHAVLGGTL